ncbi:amidohydrolase family protein, partial [Halorubrum sp. Hd13]
MNALRVTGGRVLRPDGSVTVADVTIDSDAGRILAVGDDAAPGAGDAPAAPDETLDAEGSLVIPGLVNAHTHAAMTLLRGYADDKPLDAWLREDIWPAEAELTDDDIEAGAALGALEMIRSGTTAFADMYFAMDRVAEVVDRAGLRARLGHGVVTVGKGEADARADVEESIAVARELDGAADGRIRTAFMPHSLTTVGEELLREGVAAAREAGVPVHLHANETVDEVDPIVDERGERPVAYAADLDALGPDDFFAHGVHLD